MMTELRDSDKAKFSTYPSAEECARCDNRTEMTALTFL